MPTTTTNFGWTVPADTDLVKDGAAAIRTALGGPDTSFVDLKGGTTGQVLSKATGTDLDFTWVTAAQAATYAVFADQKAQGTPGGTFTNGAWRTRDINTTQFNNISGASIASNQITLPAGTYKLTASATAAQVNEHTSRLYNVTDASVTIIGKAQYTDSTSLEATNESTITGVFTIAATKVFEIQHRCSTTRSTDGFGVFASTQAEVYTVVSIVKI